jgi:hypothetical protein
MESRGADVVSCDLSYEHEWDVVPFARADVEGYTQERQAHIHRLNNGFWFTHKACKLRSKVVYSPIYSVPAAVGPVDICTFGSVLLHLRDPFLALQRALRLTRNTVVVTEAIHRNFIPTMLTQGFGRPSLVFLPRYRVRRPMDGWWIVTPRAVLAFLATLGFEDAKVSYHVQLYQKSRRLCYTVVAQNRWDGRYGVTADARVGRDFSPRAAA